MFIPFLKLLPNAKAPTQAHPSDAAYDLYAAEPAIFAPGQRALVKTGIAMAIPAGYYGHICGRSGLALKKGIGVMGGIIDAGYRGDVGVILINQSERPFWVEAGDRIAQIIIKKCESVEWVEVGPLVSSERGEAGFGSSGA